MPELQFREDGAQRFRCALSVSEVEDVLRLLDKLPPEKAGLRLQGLPGLADILAISSPTGRIAASLIGPNARPVRALLFDKTPETNWSLPWHQDRTVVVRARDDTPGYGPWSTKAGLIHVAPPFHVLEGMATLRLHLDPVNKTNAPLLIAPGSHRLGRVPEGDVVKRVEQLGRFTCIADVGDVWAYATPIIHASEAAVRPRRRRVLQIDYAAHPLGGELEWLGV